MSSSSLILDKVATALTATPVEAEETLFLALEKAKRIFITGAGRSGLVARFFAMRLLHCGYTVHVVGEITAPSIQAGDLFIVISGSGETETMLPLVAKAKKQLANIALVSMKSVSSMAALADTVVAVASNNPQAFDKTPQMPMGSIFELSSLLFLEAVIAKVIAHKQLSEEQMRAIHANLE